MYFCDDVKRHILSFLGAKPMKLTDIDDIADLIHKWGGCHSTGLSPFIYRLRMRISFEQLQFEQSAVGVGAREKYVALRLEQCKRSDVQAELLQYHILAANDFNGVFRIPDSFRRVEWEAYMLALLMRTLRVITKDYFLNSVKIAGKKSANKFRRRERVCCEFCGKEVSRNSLSRHKKTHL